MVSGWTLHHVHCLTSASVIYACTCPVLYLHVSFDRFEVTRSRMCQMTDDMARTFYIEHMGRPFYPTLVQFMTWSVESTWTWTCTCTCTAPAPALHCQRDSVV